jgi:orotate phosphoribosyltransferase
VQIADAGSRTQTGGAEAGALAGGAGQRTEPAGPTGKLIKQGIKKVLMPDLMPQFRDFAERHLLSGRYDYLIPVECKGMLILNDVLQHSDSSHSPEIINRRGLDFIPRERLAGKRVAVVDDTVFTGRTINRLINEIRRLGAAEAEGYAFLLYDNDKLRGERHIDDVRVCNTLTPDEYRLLADQMSELSLRARPSYPDHLTFRVSFTTAVDAGRVAAISSQRGMVVRHRRAPDHITWSVHWPDWTPQLASYARDTGHDKMRFRMDPVSRHLYASPVVFPALEESADLDGDELAAGFHAALSRPWHDPETRSRNTYEAFTLATRVKQATGFLADLRAWSNSVDSADLVPGALRSYYGPACPEVERLCNDGVRRYAPEPRQPRSMVLDLEDTHPLRRHAAAAAIITSLRDDYDRLNSDRPSEYEYDSVGRTVDELCQKTGLPEGLVVIVAEELNDNGHLSPLPFDRRTGDRPLRLRSYRVTETAAAWLYPTGEDGVPE